MSKVAPPPPPEAVPAYQKKGEESGGVLAMMDMLTADLDKEIQETQVEEKNAQEEYETFCADSAAKRAADATSIAEKTAAKADLAASLEQMTGEKKTKMTEAMAKLNSSRTCTSSATGLFPTSRFVRRRVQAR